MAKKNKTIVLKAKRKIKEGKVVLFDVWETLLFNNPFFEKKAHNPDGYISVTKKGLISNVFLNKESGSASVHAHVKLSQLKSMLKQAEKMKTYWAKVNAKDKRKGKLKIKSSCIHLNPEITFIVKYD